MHSAAKFLCWKTEFEPNCWILELNYHTRNGLWTILKLQTCNKPCTVTVACVGVVVFIIARWQHSEEYCVSAPSKTSEEEQSTTKNARLHLAPQFESRCSVRAMGLLPKRSCLFIILLAILLSVGRFGWVSVTLRLYYLVTHDSGRGCF